LELEAHLWNKNRSELTLQDDAVGFERYRARRDVYTGERRASKKFEATSSTLSIQDRPQYLVPPSLGNGPAESFVDLTKGKGGIPGKIFEIESILRRRSP